MSSIDFEPLRKQVLAWKLLEDQTTKQVLYGGSAGSGKSYFGCAWIVIQCLRYPGTRWMIGRSKRSQLMQTTMKTFVDVCASWNLKADADYAWNRSTNEIKFSNGSEVFLKNLFRYPSDPEFDSLGSLEITGAFIDEASQVCAKARDVVTSRLRYKLDEYGLIGKLLMTCNPSKNFLYKEFYQPSLNDTLEKTKAFVRALPSDNPRLPKDYVETLRGMDRNSRERLLYGNWEYDDDPSCLMDYPAISGLFTNFHVASKPSDSKCVSVDVARMGSDSTVITVWDGLRVVEIVKKTKTDTAETARIVREQMNRHGVPVRNVVVDTDGVGGGVADQLKGSYNFLNGGKPLNGENFANLKTQCYFKLAELVNASEILISAKDDETVDAITEELEQVKRASVDSDGKLRMVSKADMKEHLGRSPDYADSLMMRMVFILRKAGSGSYCVDVA